MENRKLINTRIKGFILRISLVQIQDMSVFQRFVTKVSDAFPLLLFLLRSQFKFKIIFPVIRRDLLFDKFHRASAIFSV